jgi:Mitochondrial carrier protein
MAMGMRNREGTPESNITGMRKSGTSTVMVLILFLFTAPTSCVVSAFGSSTRQSRSTCSCSSSASFGLGNNNNNACTSVAKIPRGGSTTTSLSFSPAVHSILAGSIAGAIGVGVAFPLDTLKTKAQVIGQQQQQQQDESANMNMLQITQLIYQSEGIVGFFGGVRGMMIGQAIIKATAFSANTFMLNTLMGVTFPNTVIPLILAAAFAGFVTSFLVAPIERIKVMMQASDSYANELDCARAVLIKEGWPGLLGRGLGPTLAREVPSYGIYFVVYGVLSQTPLAVWLGPAAPLINGALSGMACWLPVYPVDVVKTLVQNTEGGTTVSSWSVAKQLYLQGGVGAFFDGLTPKMLRAALNHSVTFYMYDIIMRSLTTPSV